MINILKKVLILSFIFILSLPSLIYSDDNNKIDRYSKSSILIDQNTNRVMFEKDADIIICEDGLTLDETIDKVVRSVSEK